MQDKLCTAEKAKQKNNAFGSRKLSKSRKRQQKLSQNVQKGGKTLSQNFPKGGKKSSQNCQKVITFLCFHTLTCTSLCFCSLLTK